MAQILPEVFCMFHTKMGKNFEIPSQQFKIKSNSNPDQLNLIVKKLLKVHNKNTDQNFDFLLNGELLIGDIQSYMHKQQLTGEKTLHLEYIKKIGEPQTKKQVPTEDWVNKIYKTDASNNKILVCLSSGEVEILDRECNKVQLLTPLQEESEYSQNILSQTFVENSEQFLLFQSSFFGELFLSQINKQNLECKTKFLFDNNTPFSCVETDMLQHNIFLGDEEGKLIVAQYDSLRNNLETKRVSEVHQMTIENILSISEFELLTSSSDESLKILDLMTLKSNFEMYFKESQISCLDYSFQERLIYTGHAQGMIRTFDERTRSKSPVIQFNSYHKYISQVKINQENPFQFISSDYDGIIRTWDKRMTKAIYEIKNHDDKKIFALSWQDKNQFLSGGESRKVVKHVLNQV